MTSEYGDDAAHITDILRQRMKLDADDLAEVNKVSGVEGEYTGAQVLIDQSTTIHGILCLKKDLSFQVALIAFASILGVAAAGAIVVAIVAALNGGPKKGFNYKMFGSGITGSVSLNSLPVVVGSEVNPSHPSEQ